MTVERSEVIPPDIREEILARLHGAEQEHEVRILFAIESGSRAWGFASPTSDYDVRFIYAHPRSWHVAVEAEERRDVIEYPITDDIDLNGWDVRKALRLFWKCNPAFVEWIQSPISYIEADGFRRAALDLLPAVYVPSAVSITTGAWQGRRIWAIFVANRSRSRSTSTSSARCWRFVGSTSSRGTSDRVQGVA